MNTAEHALSKAVLSFSLPEQTIRERIHQIQQRLLASSRHVRERNFTAISCRDLDLLFGAYDELFFTGLCDQALAGRKFRFRLSPRMTTAGGKTTRYRSITGEVSYEIAIASGLLFDGFGGKDRQATVCGLECGSRLEALQRIFEHEMVHLIEQLCWEISDCSEQRFQDIASRCFLHQAHTHNLVTRRERAADLGIRVGAEVVFEFEGRQLTGRVNRITKRATVLVEDPNGQPYSNGRRYRIYYVPIRQLQIAVNSLNLQVGP